MSAILPRKKGQDPRTMDPDMVEALAKIPLQLIILSVRLEGFKSSLRIACVGPVVHAPHAGLDVIDIDFHAVEFGPILSGDLARAILNGEITALATVQ